MQCGAKEEPDFKLVNSRELKPEDSYEGILVILSKKIPINREEIWEIWIFMRLKS